MKFVKKLLGLMPSSSKPKQQKPHQLSVSDVVTIANGDSTAAHSRDELNTVINTLAYASELIAIASKESKLQRQALLRIASLLSSGDVSLRQIRQDISDISLLLIITSNSNDEKLTESVLTDLNNESDLAALCEQTPSSQLRLKLVEKVHTEDNLKRLEKTLKTKDKTCYKIVRQKLDAFKEEKTRQQAKQDKLNSLEAELNAHAQRKNTNDYAFKLDTLVRRKASFADDGTAEWHTKLDELIAHCRTIANATQKEQAKTQPAEAQPNKTNISANPEFDAIVEQYYHAGNAFLSGCFSEVFTIETTLNQLQLLNDQWDALKEKTTPTDEQTKQKTHIAEAITSTIFTLSNNETIHAALKNLNDDTLADAQIRKENKLLIRFKSTITGLKLFQHISGNSDLCNAIKTREKTLKDKELIEKEKHKNISGLIRKASYAVQNGQLKRAQGIRHSIKELIDACANLPSHVEKQWEELQQKTDDLGDWHAYAATPKLEALVAEMTTLSDAPLTAELQATQIHKLQEQWKSISKGAGGRYQELWDTFKAAADKAYEPCKQHYEELDAIRQSNANKRDELIEQLNQYIDSYNWASADWAQVEKLVRSAKTEWQNYHPVPRNNQREQQNRFNEKIDIIQAKLTEEYDKNKAEKERLIKGLEPLTQSDDLANAIDIAVKFQKQWKSIGRCRHKDEDKLWKAFRTHCDAIFAKRDAERNAEKSKLDALVAQANTVVSELEELLKSDVADFEKGYRDIDQITARFDAIEDLPKGAQSSLQSRLRKTVNALETRFKHIQKERNDSGWTALFAIKEQLNTALISKHEAALSEHIETLNSLSFTPGQSQKALLALATQNSTTQEDDAEQAYRLICIKAEVFSNTETPETDKAMRMQYQVSQLQAGLGNKAQDKLSLAEEWFSVGPVSDSLYAELSTRFTTCWQHI